MLAYYQTTCVPIIAAHAQRYSTAICVGSRVQLASPSDHGHCVNTLQAQHSRARLRSDIKSNSLPIGLVDDELLLSSLGHRTSRAFLSKCSTYTTASPTARPSATLGKPDAARVFSNVNVSRRPLKPYSVSFIASLS